MKNISINQAKDTGLAITLILLLFDYFSNQHNLVLSAIIILILTMTFPKIFTPLAYVWFGLSHALGNFISKVLLSVIFFVIVTPVAIVRRVLGFDSMKTKAWKAGENTAFVDRDHLFVPKDLEKPY